MIVITEKDKKRGDSIELDRQVSPEQISQLFLKHLINEHGYTKEQIIGIVDSNEQHLPISIFDNEKLGALETITKYLREVQNFEFKEIAELLGRNHRSIWTTYRNSKQKMPFSLNISSSKYSIPVSIFSNRDFSILENLVKYLKEHYELTYHKIGLLLRRNERTIWTVYKRSLSKGGGS